MKANFKVVYTSKCNANSNFLYVFNFYGINEVVHHAYSEKAKILYGGQIGVWKIKSKA